MFAGHHKLDNLCVIVDNNGLQIDGPVAEVSGPEPIDEKFEAFGFDVITIDGNDFDEIEAAFARGPRLQGQAHRHHRQDRQGQGRLLYGEPGGLARQGPQRPSSTKLP